MANQFQRKTLDVIYPISREFLIHSRPPFQLPFSFPVLFPFNFHSIPINRKNFSNGPHRTTGSPCMRFGHEPYFQTPTITRTLKNVILQGVPSIRTSYSGGAMCLVRDPPGWFVCNHNAFDHYRSWHVSTVFLPPIPDASSKLPCPQSRTQTAT